MIKRYRKKPVEIEAMLFDGDIEELESFVGDDLLIEAYGRDSRVLAYIRTLEGKMLISDGDYVIKGIQGEFYPCKPDIFKATYNEQD